MIRRWPQPEHRQDFSAFHWPPALQGHFDATAVSLEVDHAFLRNTLPPELVTNRARYDKLHPLLLLVGTQRTVHPVAFGQRLHFPALRPYQEACIVIPDVCYRDRAQDHDAPGHTYFGRLYLDQSLPTICGRWPWGWNKCLAKFQRSDKAVSIKRRGEILLNIEMLPAATASNDSVWMSLEWNRVVQWLNQPAIIGRKVCHRPRRLEFHWPAANVLPANVDVAIGPSLVQGVAARSVTSDGRGHSGCHAFHFDAPWYLHTSMAHDAGRRAAA
jgi:hypothetical protein